MVHAYDLHTQEAEVRGSQIQSQPSPHDIVQNKTNKNLGSQRNVLVVTCICNHEDQSLDPRTYIKGWASLQKPVNPVSSQLSDFQADQEENSSSSREGPCFKRKECCAMIGEGLMPFFGLPIHTGLHTLDIHVCIFSHGHILTKIQSKTKRLSI